MNVRNVMNRFHKLKSPTKIEAKTIESDSEKDTIDAVKCLSTYKITDEAVIDRNMNPTEQEE